MQRRSQLRREVRELRSDPRKLGLGGGELSGGLSNGRSLLEPLVSKGSNFFVDLDDAAFGLLPALLELPNLVLELPFKCPTRLASVSFSDLGTVS